MEQAVVPIPPTIVITSASVSAPIDQSVRLARMLRWSATSWCVVAQVGQLIFAFYIATLYGRTAMVGRLDLWNAAMPHGHTVGSPFHNSTVALHLLFALVLLISGPTQMMPVMTNPDRIRLWPNTCCRSPCCGFTSMPRRGKHASALLGRRGCWPCSPCSPQPVSARPSC